MNRMRCTIVSIFLMITLVLCPISNIVRAQPDSSGDMGSSGDQNVSTDERENAIAFLNYLCYVSQDINDSANNRLYLEEIYSKLINNTKPQNVDDHTKSEILDLLDVIERHRLIDVKRERLKLIHEQNQSNAIRSALPDAHSVMNVVLSSKNFISLAFSVCYMATDSWTGYKNSISQSEKEFFEANASLDDAEAAEFHARRKGMFSYMVDMCKKFSLDSSLNENQIKQFVSMKNETNVTLRISQLESQKYIYKTFGSYWLLLANSYFEEGEYQKCVDAIESYRDLNIGILRYDYDYANALPKAMAAKKYLYENRIISKAEYENYILTGCQDIEKNIDVQDWSLRYFVAQSYIDLYNSTNNIEFLKKAYQMCSDTVAFLVGEQRKLNSTYLNAVVSVDPPQNATKDVKNEYSRYNQELKNNRKTELPPAYEPLLLHCDLLFAIAEKLNLDSSEKSKINRILHENDTPLFLTDTLDGYYWFDNKGKVMTPNDMIIEYDKDTIVIPASYATQNISITVSVASGGSTAVFDDWQIKKVDRDKEGDINTFTAKFTSEKADDYDWQGGEIVSITIYPHSGIDKNFSFNFRSINTKYAWYKYLAFWESKIKFERI